MKKLIKIIVVALVAAAAVLPTGCSRNAKLKWKASLDVLARKDAFYETTRFIMTRQEKNIYLHMPDKNGKNLFIKEFWKKRDPFPETEENENRIEYEHRIEFANKWFKDRPDGRGWDTERGRLLLQLGMPDSRETRITTLRGTTWQVKTDSWYYYEYDLYLQFADLDGFGQFKLRAWPQHLLDSLDRAKLALDMNKQTLLSKFDFKVKFKPGTGTIEIIIPVKHVDFEEAGDNVKASFNVQVYVYRNYKKIDSVKKEQKFTRSKAEVLKLKHMVIPIPYSPPGKGKYYLEAIVKDMSKALRFRNFHKFKVKS